MRKTPLDGRGVTSVTFDVPAQLSPQRAFLVGDFNDWSTSATEMTPRKDGRHSVTLRLNDGHHYRFQYLLDGERWENDWAADHYEPTPFASEDSVVEL